LPSNGFSEEGAGSSGIDSGLLGAGID